MHRLLPPRLIVALGLTAVMDMYMLSPFFGSLVRLDVWVIMLVFYYLFHEGRRSIVFALTVGVFCDVLGHGLFGASLLSMTIASFFLVRFSDTLSWDRWYIQIFLVFLACMIVRTLELLFACVYLGEWVWFGYFRERVISPAAVTALASPFIFRMLRKHLVPSPRQFELFS